MAAFTRTERRMIHQGLQLTRSLDGCDPGKWPISENVRSVIPGTIQARAGMLPVDGANFGDPIHTIQRYDDATQFASDPHLYLIGAGDTVYSGDVGGPFSSADSGYSGDPLSIATATPSQAPQPWAY